MATCLSPRTKRSGCALAMVCAFGCGPSRDLSQPFAPLSVESPEIPAEQARSAFAHAISLLGGRIQEDAEQRISIRFDAACDCRSCNQNTVEHVERTSPDLIQICPWYAREPADGLTDNIVHAVGHVMGRWDHLPCETGAMLSPSYNCRQEHAQYQDLDIESICAAGHVTGGVCG